MVYESLPGIITVEEAVLCNSCFIYFEHLVAVSRTACDLKSQIKNFTKKGKKQTTCLIRTCQMSVPSSELFFQPSSVCLCKNFCCL